MMAAAQMDLEDYGGVSPDPRRASMAEVAAAYRDCLLAASAVMRLDATLVPARLDGAKRGASASKQERLLTLARQLAVYVLNCEIGFRQFQCAYVAGVARAGALYIVRSVEDMREDPYVDAMIDAIAERVAHWKERASERSDLHTDRSPAQRRAAWLRINGVRSDKRRAV